MGFEPAGLARQLPITQL